MCRKIIILSICLFICASVYGKVSISVKNRLKIASYNQTISIDWKLLQTKIDGLQFENVVVFDSVGKQIPSQVTYDGKLIFQVDLKPKQIVNFIVDKGERDVYVSKVYGRLVPERMDDWTWENDKVAFRVYGPALEQSGEISGGIDIWAKRTKDLVIDKWYAGKDYHVDHGQGLDMYKVGPTLGAGATTPFYNGKLVLGHNFVNAQLLDKGPVRTTVLLTYAPLVVGLDTVFEKRIISLDAGQYFNKITVSYGGNFGRIKIATGIFMSETATCIDNRNIIALGDKYKDHGVLYIGVIGKKRAKSDYVDGHIVRLNDVRPNQKMTYYAGSRWSPRGKDMRINWWINEMSNNELRFKIAPRVIVK